MRRADKRFVIVGIPGEDGRSRKALHVTCSRCGAHDDYTVTSKTPPPSDVISNWFERRGWQIGRNSGRDICPACNAKDQAEAKKRKEAKMTNPSIKEQLAALGKIPVLGAVGDPPKPEAAALLRPLTRADRRAVMDVLDRVYPDPEKGYTGGYSDKRVADEMNVPRVWVSTVRGKM